MLNGHSLNSLRNGGATLQYDTINLQNVKRIEVVRGPASAVYGENAFTAIINIITKSAEEINGIEASIRTGSFNTQSYNILFGKKINDISISANVNYVTSDGYKAFIPQDSVGNSGYTNPTTQKTSAYLNLESKGFYFMGQYTNREEGPRFGPLKALDNRTLLSFESYFLELGYKKEITETISVQARVYYDRMNADNKLGVFPPGFPDATYIDGVLSYSSGEEEKKGIELLGTYKQDNFTLLTGLMYERQALNNPSERQNYDPLTFAPYAGLVDIPADQRSIDQVKREFHAFYAELLYDMTEDIRLTVGGRYDHFSDFGDNFNPRLGATWKLNKSNNFKVMYGTAFRAPTFAELYNKNNPVIVGNPELNPEQIETIELSWHNSDIDQLDMTFTLFKSNISDIVSLDSTGKEANVGHVQTTGLESEFKYKLGRGSYVMVNYTYQDPLNENTNTRMADVSKHKVYLALNYRLDTDYNLYVDANYRGKQFRESGDTRAAVSGFTIANATLLVKNILTKKTKLRLSIYNMFNEKAYDSATPFDYPIAERSIMAELTYKF